MTVSIRILELGTLSPLVSLHDPANGKHLLRDITLPSQVKRQARIKSARAHGSYGVGAAVRDDGTVVLHVRFEGASWAEAATRTNAVLDVLEGLDKYLLEVAQDGVTTRWYSDAPVDMLPEPIDRTSRLLHRRDYELRFTVQPSPTVTIV